RRNSGSAGRSLPRDLLWMAIGLRRNRRDRFRLGASLVVVVSRSRRPPRRTAAPDRPSSLFPPAHQSRCLGVHHRQISNRPRLVVLSLLAARFLKPRLWAGS